MWPLTVPPLPLLLLPLLCSGLAGQVGARRAGVGAGESRRAGARGGSSEKRGRGLHEPPPQSRRVARDEGRGSQRGRGWDIHPGMGE